MIKTRNQRGHNTVNYSLHANPHVLFLSENSTQDPTLLSVIRRSVTLTLSFLVIEGWTLWMNVTSYFVDCPFVWVCPILLLIRCRVCIWGRDTTEGTLWQHMMSLCHIPGAVNHNNVAQAVPAGIPPINRCSCLLGNW